jgi:hypothetical protein
VYVTVKRRKERNVLLFASVSPVFVVTVAEFAVHHHNSTASRVSIETASAILFFAFLLHLILFSLNGWSQV